MATLKTNLELLMSERRLTESELGRQSGVGQPVINRILNEETQSPRSSTLHHLADFFDIAVPQLIGKEPLPINRISKHIHPYLVPIIPQGSMHKWPSHKEELLNQHLKWVSITTDISENAFALIMQGKTMSPLFAEGTILIFESSVQARDGDFIAVELNNSGDVLIKELILDGANMYLRSPNPDIKTIHIQTPYRILGVMIQARINLREKTSEKTEELNFIFYGKPVKGVLYNL